LLIKEIDDIRITNRGRLTVHFHDGSSLIVESNERYESWQLSSAEGGFLVVCTPGGEVSVFEENAKEHKGDSDGLNFDQ
jgi:hypothetical protein